MERQEFEESDILFAALCISSVAVPASAQNVVAWWSQIMGSDTAPNNNGTLTPLNLHARFVVHDPSLSSQTTAQALCDQYSLTDQNGNALSTPWTARYNGQYFTEYTVCDAALPDGQGLNAAGLQNAASGSAINAMMRGPSGTAQSVAVTFPGSNPVGRSGNGIRMAVFGDSGCRGRVRHGSQVCGGDPTHQTADWVFPDLIDDSILPAQQSDVVLHVGDYRYRGQSYSVNTWDWDHWNDDLFAPAQPSMAQVPWAFSRGNHEVCDEGLKYSGVGFFLFFGRDNVTCKSTNSINGTTLMAPWFFDLADLSGATPTAHHRIVMVDNASNSDAAAHVADYQAAFEWAQTGWAGAPASAWIASHRPIFGLDTADEHQNDTRDLGFIQTALQQASSNVQSN